MDSSVVIINSLILEGYSDKESIFLMKIIRANRRVYISKKISRKINHEEIEIQRLNLKQKPNKNNGFKSYRDKVWEETNKHKNEIVGIEKRGFKTYHIDHIIPISYGYKNNICPKIIGGKSNIRMLHYKENMKKGVTLTNDSKKLLNRLGL